MNTQFRSILVISGSREDCLSECQQTFDSTTLLVSHDQVPDTRCINFQQATTQLGQEQQHVIFDATESFQANALGAISGTIVGGGRLTLLLPDNNASQYPHPRFLERLLCLLAQHEIPVWPCGSQAFIERLSVSGPWSNPQSKSTVPSLTLHGHDLITLNAEQQNVVEAVIKVANGRRRRPLVLSADRGRGKSTALGVAAKALLAQGLQHIIVCAPAKAMIAPLLQPTQGLDGITYWAPDALKQQRPQADLVIIDEAGAIPVPLLKALLQHYPRMVFSTTLQGYEGNGRGFAVRFQSHLDTATPNWRRLSLQQPVRWGLGDPLEQLINRALLLDAKLPEREPLDVTPSALTCRKISTCELLDHPTLLEEVVGLLVTAHYQTRPSDIVQLMDDTDISIHLTCNESQLLAVAIVHHEGGLSTEMSEHIFSGIRRPKGHLVPQILTYQVGISRAATLCADRIMRIAVHPDYQSQGVGRALLSTIKAHSEADYLASSFGLSINLLHFWQQSSFQAVYLGLKREASSGYHSAVVMCPLSPEGQSLFTEAQSAFRRHFSAQLADVLRDLDPQLALALLSKLSVDPTFQLSAQESQDIQRFANQVCGYDLVMSALRRWLPNALAENHNRIRQGDAVLLVMRVLQHHPWAHCCDQVGLSGKQDALTTMQKTTSLLLQTLE